MKEAPDTMDDMNLGNNFEFKSGGTKLKCMFRSPRDVLYEQIYGYVWAIITLNTGQVLYSMKWYSHDRNRCIQKSYIVVLERK